MRKKFLVKQKYLLILKSKKMKNLKNLNLVELNAQEVKETEGGWLQYLPVAVAVGAAFVWAWDKGEELGKALAKNH